MELAPAAYGIIFVFGLLFGSFFNVAIHRWPQEDPKDREWVKTPSHCPKCSAKIRWYDNIPIVSWTLLGAKCRDCKAPISWRYPAVELLTALLWVLSAWLVVNLGLVNVPPDEIRLWHIGIVIFLVSLYELTVIIDFETGLIPDEIIWPHLVIAWLFMWVCHGATISPDWLSSLIAMFGLPIFFALFAFFGAMGWGDVFFALGMGVTFGWPLIAVVGLLGIFMGGIVGMFFMIILIARKKYKRGTPIPFGPYLGFASFFCLFWGDMIGNWYLNLVGLPTIF